MAFGPRSALGFFLTPLSQANGWGRDVFAIALAVQNLLWGDRRCRSPARSPTGWARVRVIIVGAILYALGLAGMAYSPTVGLLNLTAGVLIGLGLAGASPLMVIGAFGKLLPERYRALSFGASTAAGSFGQFLFSPLAVALIALVDWHQALDHHGVAGADLHSARVTGAVLAADHHRRLRPRQHRNRSRRRSRRR